MQVFETFFGTANPFASLIEGERELWQELAQQKLSEPPPIEMDCFVTLEELYNGCTKVFKVLCALNPVPPITPSPSHTAQMALGCSDSLVCARCSAASAFFFSACNVAASVAELSAMA